MPAPPVPTAIVQVLLARPKVLIAAGAVVVVVFAAILMGGGSSETTSGNARETHRAEKISFRVDTTAAGELQAKNERKLISLVERQTMITEIVDEGSMVKQGDVLIRLAEEEIKKQLDNDRLSLESAKSDLISAQNALKIQESDNKSNLSKAELKLDIAKLELDKWTNGDVKAKREELDKELNSATRQQDRLKRKFDHSEDLLEKEFVSQDEHDQDKIAWLEAESRLKIAKIRIEVYEEYEHRKDEKQKRSDIDEAEAELERVVTNNDSQLANRRADLSNKTAQLAIRENKVEDLEEQLANCTIIAPTDGLVVYATSVGNNWRWNNQGPLAVGRQVHHNEELIVLPDTSEMNAVIKVHESMIGKIFPGLEAVVTIDAAGGQKFTGRVDEIGIMAESGGWRDPNLREYEVKINLELGDSDHGLKPSMRCEAEVIMDNVADALAVPSHAVFAEGTVTYVYSPKGSRYVRMPVITGRRSDNHIEILGGLKENQRVALIDPDAGRVIEREFDMEQIAKMREEAGVPEGGPRMLRTAMMRHGMKDGAEGGAKKVGSMNKEDMDAKLQELKDELDADLEAFELDDDEELLEGEGELGEEAALPEEAEGDTAVTTSAMKDQGITSDD
jgi:HlyD family secretion protein